MVQADFAPHEFDHGPTRKHIGKTAGQDDAMQSKAMLRPGRAAGDHGLTTMRNTMEERFDTGMLFKMVIRPCTE